MKKGILIILLVLFSVALILSLGCTDTSDTGAGDVSNSSINSTVQATASLTTVATETVITPTNTPEQTTTATVDSGTTEGVYVPMWPAGTLLSDDEGKAWGLITKVDKDKSEYLFRNVIKPENGDPYIIKDSSFEQMGSSCSAKAIDEKYVNYEGKAARIAITSITGRTVVGYLVYDTKESMKHTTDV